MNAARRALSAAAGLALLCAGGCERPAQRSAPDAAARPMLAAQQAPVAPRVTKQEGPKVKALIGALAGGQLLAPGEALAPDRVLVLEPGARLTLDFAKGARVELSGPAQLVVAPRAAQALLLQSGVATVDLPPSAPTPDSGFWLASPGLRLELVRGGRLALRALPDGSTAAFVVSGSARPAGVEPDPGLLVAGQGLRAALDGSVERLQSGALTLDAARERVLRLSARAGDAAHVRAALDPHVAQLADTLAQELARERSLVAAHRARIGAPDALQAQAALAEQAAQLARLRTRLRALLARRAAARLEPVSVPDDALGQRAEALLVR